MQVGTGFICSRNCLLKTLRCCRDFLIPVSQAGSQMGTLNPGQTFPTHFKHSRGVTSVQSHLTLFSLRTVVSSFYFIVP